MMNMKYATILTVGLASGALSLPLSAAADPPAVSAPGIPPVFTGAPRTDDPSGGEFTLNFDGDGRFLGIGRLPDPPQVIDVSTPRELRQAQVAASGPTATEEATTDRQIAALRQELRSLGGLQTAQQGR